MDGLTRVQRDELRADLERIDAELRGLVAASEEGTRPVELDEPIGRLSRMEAIQQQHMAKANRGAVQTRQRQVVAALRRLETGEYGVCLMCEEPVGYPRLKVRPEAPLCIDCQGRRERGA